MKTRIGVRTCFAGLHHWPTAPKDKPNGFLQYPHRHTFHLEVLFNVEHADRQIEFFDAEWHLNQCVRDLYGTADVKDLGSRSCEMIARELYHHMKSPFKDAVLWIKVQEDTENYAVIHI